jgi:hypothetical protein
MIAATTVLSSGTSTRSAMLASATLRSMPTRTSCPTRVNSSAIGPVARSSGSRDGSIDSEAGLHHHADLVDHVGELAPDLLVAGIDLTGEQGVGNEEADHGGGDDQKHAEQREVDEQE